MKEIIQNSELNLVWMEYFHEEKGELIFLKEIIYLINVEAKIAAPVSIYIQITDQAQWAISVQEGLTITGGNGTSRTSIKPTAKIMFLKVAPLNQRLGFHTKA